MKYLMIKQEKCSIVNTFMKTYTVEPV